MTKFFFGLALGVGVGLLFAPAEGSKTRERLENKIEDFKEYPRRKLHEQVERGREKAGEIGRKAAQRAYDETTQKVIGEV